MSCASPLAHLSSPPSLLMYNQCTLNFDDDPHPHFHSSFSFAFPTPPLPASSSSSSSRPPSRTVLTDIIPPKHTSNCDSPRNPLNNVAAAAASSPCLRSPKHCRKENWENTLKIITQKDVRENGGPIDARVSSPCLRSPKHCSKENTITTCENGGPTVDTLVVSSPSPSPLKRKRPAKLAIPEFARLASFGKVKDFEMPEHVPLTSDIQSLEAPLFAVSCKKGRRDCMEDAHIAITNFLGNTNQAFFGVFDGHGGKMAAQFAAENLGQHIAMAIENPKGKNESLEDAMHAGYLSLDSEFLAKGVNSGACSVSAFLKEGQLVVANAGDCKVVLCRDGKAEALSDFHRASNVAERLRIENLGGYVDCFNGVWRLQGTLAVTRGFGDRNLKKWVSAQPEVRQLNITRSCEFLILASDGLWDKVSDQEAVDCVGEVLGNSPANGQEALDLSIARPSKAQKHHQWSFPCSAVDKENNGKALLLKIEACNKLIHKANGRGNLDDITVMVVPLQGFHIA